MILLRIRGPPRATHFPYTTRFRSEREREREREGERERERGAERDIGVAEKGRTWEGDGVRSKVEGEG